MFLILFFLNFFLNQFAKVHVFLKVDSDSFVRLGAFLKALRDIADPNLYWGFLDGRARPKRKGQWAERDWIICDRYVPYQVFYYLKRNYLDRSLSQI